MLTVNGEPYPHLDRKASVAAPKLLANMASAMARDVPLVPYVAPDKAHGRHLVICGAGPSLARYAEALKRIDAGKARVWAVNGAADWLRGEGVRVHAQVLLDAHPTRMLDFVQTPSRTTRYLVASVVDPSVWDALEGQRVFLWHARSGIQGEEALVQTDTRGALAGILVGGGSTTALRAMVLGHRMGYRGFHLLGCDSSFAGEQQHVTDDARGRYGEIVEAELGGETFVTTPTMARQVNAFLWTLENADREIPGAEVWTYGDGLLPAAAKEWNERHDVQIRREIGAGPGSEREGRGAPVPDRALGLDHHR